MKRHSWKRLNQEGLTRRSLLQTSAALLSVPFVATAAKAQDKLAGRGEVVVFSYGGTFSEAARKHVFRPFTKATGIEVVDVVADFAEPHIKAMHEAGRFDWDIAFVEARNFPEMSEAGMFEPIDYTLWDEESIDGTPSDSRLKEAFVVGITAEVLTYDQRTFADRGPKNWADFWDVRTFPGPRGLMGDLGIFDLQFALVADGVAARDIWPLDDKQIDRALKKLDEIKPHVVKWWVAGGEPTQLLLRGEYAMTLAHNNRVIQAIRTGAPFKMVYEGSCLVKTLGTILHGGPNTANAQKFVAFLNRAQIAAEWTLGTGWPGANTNQLKHMPPDLARLLSVNPDNASVAVIQDSAWLAKKRSDGKTNSEHLEERFIAWKTQ